MTLFELFNTSADWQWTSRTPTRWLATMRVGDSAYTVYFAINQDLLHGSVWEIEFGLNGMYPGDPEMGIVGNKPAAQVFSVVIQIIRDFASAHRGEKLLFTAEEPSRVSLYKRLVNKLAPQSKMYYDDYDGMYYIVQM